VFHAQGVLAQAGEVDRGVELSVNDRAAVLTPVYALGQGELGFHHAAGRAGLRAGIPPVRYHQPTAIPSGLVAELSAHPAESGIGDGPVQPAAARAAAGLAPAHPGHIQILHHNHLVALRQLRGGLVQRVSA
jgi:hypothetical protein